MYILPLPPCKSLVLMVRERKNGRYTPALGHFSWEVTQFISTIRPHPSARKAGKCSPPIFSGEKGFWWIHRFLCNSPVFCHGQTLWLLAKQLITLASVPFIIKESKTLTRLLDIYIKKVLLRYREAWFNKAFIRIIISLKVDLMRNEN